MRRLNVPKARLNTILHNSLIKEAWNHNDSDDTEFTNVLMMLRSALKSLPESASYQTRALFQSLWESVIDDEKTIATGGATRQGPAEVKPRSMQDMINDFESSGPNGGAGVAGSAKPAKQQGKAKSEQQEEERPYGRVETSIDVRWNSKKNNGSYRFYLHTTNYSLSTNGSWYVDDGDSFWELADSPSEALEEWLDEYTDNGYSDTFATVSVYDYEKADDDDDASHSDAIGGNGGGSSYTPSSSPVSSTSSKPVSSPAPAPAPASEPEPEVQSDLYTDYQQLSEGEPSMTIENSSVQEMLSVLNQKLHEGPVAFVYEKKDGSERLAYGTLNSEYLNGVMGERGGNGNNRRGAGNKFYYDLEQQAFRQFVPDRLVAVY